MRNKAQQSTTAGHSHWLGRLFRSFWFCFGLPIAFLFSLFVFALCYLGENLGTFDSTNEYGGNRCNCSYASACYCRPECYGFVDIVGSQGEGDNFFFYSSGKVFDSTPAKLPLVEGNTAKNSTQNAKGESSNGQKCLGYKTQVAHFVFFCFVPLGLWLWLRSIEERWPFSSSNK